MDAVDAASVDRNAQRTGLLAGVSPRGRAILWLTVVFWISHLAIIIGGAVASGTQGLKACIELRLVLAVIGALMCFGIHLLLERFSGSTFRSRALIAIFLAPVAAEVYAWIVYFGYMIAGPPDWEGRIDWASAIASLSYYMWFFLAWTGLYLALNYSFDIQTEQLRSAELRAHAQSAQLRALHNQVNPHFLFNSLNSISALVADGRNAEADRMIAKLATFFRRSLSIDPFEDIPLSRELDLQRVYLEIEQLRFPDLVLDIDCPAGLAGAAVPALILQPLVENAVKYGVAGSPPPARIAVVAREGEGKLVLTVTDSGTSTPPTAKSGSGVGLRNVRERLAHRFGDDQSMVAGRGETGFTCTLAIPLRMTA